MMVIAVAAAVVGLAACGATSGDSDSASDGGGSKVIKIGSTVPRTGPNSVVLPIFQSTDACLKQINADGGINGYTFDYVMADDQYDPAKTVGAIRQLVDKDQVFALVSSGGTAGNLAIKDYLQAKGIPNIGPQTGNPKVATPNTYLFIQDSVTEGAFQAEYGLKTLGAKQLGVIFENDDVGKPFQQGAEYQAKQHKSRLLSVPFQLGTRDMVPAVSRLKARGADVVMIEGVGSVLPPIIRAADSIGYHPKWVSVAYAISPATIGELPSSQVKNMYFSSWASLPGVPEAKGMRDALKKYYPKVAPSALTVMGWVPCTLFAEAFKQATAGGKEPTRKTLIQALDGFDNYSNDYVTNITYKAKPGVSQPHVPRPRQLIASWDGSDFKVEQPFAEAPKVPGEPGQ